MPRPIENEATLSLASTILAEIEAQPSFLQLERLHQLAISTGGTWDFPHTNPEIYDPLVCELQLAGVHVYAEAVADLPTAWMNAAREAIGVERGEVIL